MARAQAGDQMAYADLLILLTSVARVHVRGRLRAAAWADDVVQETLLSVHTARHTYDPARPFAPWFYAILRHRMIDGLRRAGRTTAREVGTDVLPDVAEPAPRDDLPIDVSAVHAAIRALPDRQRDVVTALKLRDESVRDVSARLGMSESAVKVTAHRGYKALRKLLGEKK
jgi:RNA polymerase sigma-70 factor (ECF subfamily)